MDITLQLKKATPPLVTDRDEQGDIIDIFLTPPGGVGNPGVKFYYIHVTGVPDISAAKAQRLRQKLQSFDYEEDGMTDPKTGLPNQRLRNSRVWHVPRGALPGNVLNQLRNNGEVTVTWSQAKPYIRRKLAKIARDDSQNGNSYDPAQSAEITDADVIDA